MSRDGEKKVKKLYVLIVAAILLLTLVNSSLGKMETQQYSQQAENSGNQYTLYRMMVDPGGGG
ncbi:hypothetical protein ACQCWJ_05100 [Bacillus thuringiensis]|uniref:hypothetical protein n=1 Tax=Bacillus cereus group TaxID=86661 RepID=UPI000A075118|nr:MULTISPECIES: hypothetical protein [Bacillus cereus group]KAB2428730.1 hypothetical protein F8168_16735 [Bacillus cereus]MED1554763.1 hypothetical protein [Bacillus paramycoides]PEW64422.1 hypothetical protein CN448_27370 [Bacillus cereus]